MLYYKPTNLFDKVVIGDLDAQQCLVLVGDWEAVLYQDTILWSTEQGYDHHLHL